MLRKERAPGDFSPLWDPRALTAAALRASCDMRTILEADASGTLHLPASLLPQPGPGQRYRVVSENGQVVVGATGPCQANAESRKAWLKELEERRARGMTGKSGTPMQEILDDIRGDSR